MTTGGPPLEPSLPGKDLNHVFRRCHPDDARALRAAVERGGVKEAVLIGGGLIAMETAETLSARGCEAKRILQGLEFPNVKFRDGGLVAWPHPVRTCQPRTTGRCCGDEGEEPAAATETGGSSVGDRQTAGRKEAQAT